jgi:putative ABC transport system permease protein
VVTVAGAVAIGWCVVAFSLFPDTFANADIPLFVVQGVILTAAAVAMVTQNQDVIGRTLRRFSRGSLAVRLGLANPLARSFRTGLILASYSLVVFTLTFITVFSSLFQGQVDQFTREVSGGFDVMVESNSRNPIRADQLRGFEGVESVAPMIDARAEYKAPGKPDFEAWYVLGVSKEYVAGGPVALEDTGDYPDDAAAYEAMMAAEDRAIVSEFFLQQGGGPPEKPLEPGDKLEIRDPVTGNTRVLTIVAISKGAFANDGVFMSIDGVRSLYGPRVTESRYAVATKPGADPQDVAERINGAFLTNGADADAFRTIVNDNLSTQLQFFRLMQGYLAIGLVVGIAGLGVQMVRAVRERRRQVGVLRSLGFQPAGVRRAFLSEAAFIAFEGIAIGMILAIITAWQIVANDTFGGELAFTVPWLQLTVLAVGTFVASLVATATPAQQASRIRPAVALRIAD